MNRNDFDKERNVQSSRLPLLKGLAKPIAAGLALREFLAPWTGHPWDFEIWVRLGAFLQSGASPYSLLPYINGLSFAPYSVMTSISYPPLPAFIFAGIYRLYELSGSVSPFLYYFLLKHPVVIADILVALLLFKLVALRKGLDDARRVASLWLYFPFAIVVSAMWGALDPLALLLILSALYSFEIAKSYPSAVFLGLATFLKLMPVIFLPVFLLQEGLTLKDRITYATISLGIPLLGSLIPQLLLSWNFISTYSAFSYQALLPGFGGMSIFFPLSFLGSLPGALTLALSSLWVPALFGGYLYLFLRKAKLPSGLLFTTLIFSISRPVLPEQWALYPMALLVLMMNGVSRQHFLAIAAIASAYLATNNFLLVRFFSPVSVAAFNWDQFVDNSSAFSDLRYALLVAISTLFFAESVSILASRKSFLSSKLTAISAVKARQLPPYVAYLGIVSVGGALLDFAAINMVTDWRLALESHVFLGLSWISLYHIMLVVVYESVVFVTIIFSRRSPFDSIGLFILLTSLNFAASAISLVIFRLLEGTSILTTATIYLAGSVVVPERFFVTFSLLSSALGLFYMSELRSVVMNLLAGVGRIVPVARRVARA